jgi:hypothetical protein
MEVKQLEQKDTKRIIKIAKRRLIVETKSEDSIAAPGNQRNNYIIVSVTDDYGEPVTGLTVNHFKVDPMIVGPGGALVDIVSTHTGRLPGFYHINVKPINIETWKNGTYIFAVSVKKGNMQGQNLASVLMD